MVDGVFFSSLICTRAGVEEIIDTRTSDAIAIAVRFEAPIYTYENILDKAGVHLNIEEALDFQEDNASEEDEIEIETVFSEKESSFSGNSLKELHHQLEKAVENENYELAAKIRDEISKRS